MPTLFSQAGHDNYLFRGLGSELMVQANQHLIVDHGEAILMDPGGHKVYSSLFGQVANIVPPKGLKYLFFSHQDPDIVAAANGWLMVTDATAYISGLWIRFITHFGVDRLVADRVKALPDEGMTLSIGETKLKLIPAHFLHSAANFQIYDPVAKILYTGDLGASPGADYVETSDMEAHVVQMEGFHKRIMAGNKVMKAWASMARKLDIETIAPQHGAMIRGREAVAAFIDWADDLSCGIDLIDGYEIPA